MRLMDLFGVFRHITALYVSFLREERRGHEEDRGHHYFSIVYSCGTGIDNTEIMMPRGRGRAIFMRGVVLGVRLRFGALCWRQRAALCQGRQGSYSYFNIRSYVPI